VIARLGQVWRDWRYQRLLRRMAGPRILAAFAEAVPEAVFVEIGANDGQKHDHLHPFVMSGAWRGVLVEPVPYLFARLQRNYAGVDRLALENVAIADRDGTQPFFHLPEANPDERARLPE
jgi:hypothetical protein